MRILIFLLLPLKLFSQDLEGVWTGTLYNDTTHSYIPYEIAISENKGKLSGFSHSVFTTAENMQETAIKSLKIRKKDDKILLEDDDLVFNDIKEPPPKGVKKFSVLNIMKSDSGWLLVGVFQTNRTKEYISLTGSIRLKKKEKVSETKLFPKLDELNLANSLSFNQPQPKEKGGVTTEVKTREPIVATHTIQQPVRTVPKNNPSPADNNDKSLIIAFTEDTVDYTVDVKEVPSDSKKPLPVVVKKPEVKSRSEIRPTYIDIKKEIALLARVEKKSSPVLSEKAKQAIATLQQAINSQAIADRAKAQAKENTTQVIKTTAEKTIPDTQKPVTETQVVKINVPVKQPEIKTNIAVNQSIKKDEIKLPSEKVNDKVVVVPTQMRSSPGLPGPVIAAEVLAKRKIETIRSVDFKSDSLVLTLYDNGVVDGDTVSVILNGRIFMSKQMLTAKALSKTIYITPELGDSLQLILYAENLGSIAPNTGLLIIKDGEDTYQVRFSGDLQKNSAIILRRKRN